MYTLFLSVYDTLTIVPRQAGDIVAQLKAGIALKATAVRNGRETEVQARDLVPGDIVRTFSSALFVWLTMTDWQILLEEGSTIPADAKACVVLLICDLMLTSRGH